MFISLPRGSNEALLHKWISIVSLHVATVKGCGHGRNYCFVLVLVVFGEVFGITFGSLNLPRVSYQRFQSCDGSCGSCVYIYIYMDMFKTNQISFTGGTHRNAMATDKSMWCVFFVCGGFARNVWERKERNRNVEDYDQ